MVRQASPDAHVRRLGPNLGYCFSLEPVEGARPWAGSRSTSGADFPCPVVRMFAYRRWLFGVPVSKRDVRIEPMFWDATQCHCGGLART